MLGNAITDAWKNNLAENTYQDMKHTWKAKKELNDFWEINPIINSMPQSEGNYQLYGQVAANGISALTDKLPENQQNAALLLANLVEIAAARSRKAPAKLSLFAHRF